MVSATSNDWAINLSSVDKVYKGGVHALRGIDMRVARGEIFGLLGPNGAGKSTLVKILMTVIRASHAEGTMLGQPIGHKPTLARVGYLPEHHRFPEYLTGAQVIDFYGALCNVPTPERRQRLPALLELVGMKDWANVKVKGYSKGMRQRIGIAQALINEPDLVVLDEPTDGVDPVGRRDIRLMLQHLKEQGKTIFLNSHLLSELEMVCDRVAILVQGRVASHGTLDELTADQGRFEIELAQGTMPEQIRAALERLPQILWHDQTRPPGDTSDTGSLPARLRGSTLSIKAQDAVAIQPCIDALRAHALVIRAVRWNRPSLEDLFMQAVIDPTTGAALVPGAARD